jgi:hypothetical protein
VFLLKKALKDKEIEVSSLKKEKEALKRAVDKLIDESTAVK